MISTKNGKLDIELGDYIFFNLENEELIIEAKKFLQGKKYIKAYSNIGDKLAYQINTYELSNYEKVEKSIKLRPLSLENRVDFLNLINKSMEFNKLSMEDVLNLFETNSGLFIYEKKAVGAYIIKDDVVLNIYSEIYLEKYLQKLINKQEVFKIKCTSNNKALMDLLKKYELKIIESQNLYEI